MSVKKNINFKKSTMLFFLVDKRKKQTNIIINNTLERVNMDKYQELLSMRIGLDEQFEFKCKCCGKCCEHRHDITLTPVDLYKIANYYCRDITDIINRYCIIQNSGQSMIPIVSLKPVGPNESCPFLLKKKCIINKVKPSVCAMFPIGRINSLNDGQGISYVFMNPECGTKGVFQTVRKWLSDMRQLDDNSNVWLEFFAEWLNMVTEISNAYKEDKVDEGLFVMSLHELYLNWDLKQDIYEQIKQKREEIPEIKKDIISLVEKNDIN